MSVKDRLDRLEARIGEPNFEFPLATHSEMIHRLRVDMRMQHNNEEVALQMKINLIVGEIKRRTSEEIEGLTEEFRTHKTFAHNELDFIKERLDKLEALEARVEELENAEADTRWNAPDNSAKPEKFIKVVDDNHESNLMRFNDIPLIQSSWNNDSTEGGITFNLSGAGSWVIKSYSDKEVWQQHLNLIERFAYDDALLLDLTGVALSDISETSEWKSCKGLPGFCPICGKELVYYAKAGVCDCCEE